MTLLLHADAAIVHLRLTHVVCVALLSHVAAFDTAAIAVPHPDAAPLHAVGPIVDEGSEDKVGALRPQRHHASSQSCSVH